MIKIISVLDNVCKHQIHLKNLSHYIMWRGSAIKKLLFSMGSASWIGKSQKSANFYMVFKSGSTLLFPVNSIEHNAVMRWSIYPSIMGCLPTEP